MGSKLRGSATREPIGYTWALPASYWAYSDQPKPNQSHQPITTVGYTWLFSHFPNVFRINGLSLRFPLIPPINGKSLHSQQSLRPLLFGNKFSYNKFNHPN
jgi:hypothetical protein